jgi:hypothetical protein
MSDLWSLAMVTKQLAQDEEPGAAHEAVGETITLLAGQVLADWGMIGCLDSRAR